MFGIAVRQAHSDIGGGLKTADLIQSPRDKSFAQRNIGETQIETGDIAGARNTLASALRTADLIQSAEYKAYDLAGDR